MPSNDELIMKSLYVYICVCMNITQLYKKQNSVIHREINKRLEKNILSAVAQASKDKYHMSSLI